MSPNRTAPGFGLTSGIDVDFDTDGHLPDVHPSLLEYLNQDSVQRVLNKPECHYPTVTDCVVASDRISIPDVNSGGHHFPELATLSGASDSQPLSYLIQNSSVATNPQPSSHNGDQQSLGGSELIPSIRGDDATSNNTYPTTHSSFGFDHLNSSLHPSSGVSSAFSPELAEIGPSNGTFTYVDWFSFMRDCGIMDIEDD